MYKLYVDVGDKCVFKGEGGIWGGDFLPSHLHFYCNLLIAQYDTCAIILLSAPYGQVLSLFLRRLPGDRSHINFV